MFVDFQAISTLEGVAHTGILSLTVYNNARHFVLALTYKANDMNNDFPIKIDDVTLRVKKLNFKNYCGAFEIWKKDNIQFILVCNAKRSENHAWSVDDKESSKVSQEYIDKIVTAIDSHYAE